MSLDHPLPALLTLPDAPTLAVSIRARAMLFHDPRSAALLRHLEQLAATDATVLMLGESGTGKELLARHVHRLRGFDGPFVAANCGGLGEAQLEAQLFGAPGGWLAAARGGTLFLDEIGALTLALQARLLDALEAGARVRLVAATSIDLHKVVEARRFRADLFERLGTALVALPPLRERPGDIVPLAHHFIALYAAKLDLGPVELTPAAEQALLGYLWPGNIRELENVVHFALIVCADGVVRPEDLKLLPGASRPLAAHVVRPAPARALETLVRDAYAAADGDLLGTGVALGLGAAVLVPLLQRYGLQPPSPHPGTKAVPAAAHYAH